MTTLVIAEHDNAQLKGATLNTIAAAAKIGGDVHVLVAGANARAVAEQAAQAAGVSKVLLADAPQLAEGLAENLAAQVLAVASGYSHILFPATASARTWPRAWPPSWMWLRSRHHRRGIRRHLPAPDLRRQRHRHGAVGRRGQGHHRAHHRL